MNDKYIKNEDICCLHEVKVESWQERLVDPSDDYGYVSSYCNQNNKSNDIKWIWIFTNSDETSNAK